MNNNFVAYEFYGDHSMPENTHNRYVQVDRPSCNVPERNYEFEIQQRRELLLRYGTITVDPTIHVETSIRIPNLHNNWASFPCVD